MGLLDAQADRPPAPPATPEPGGARLPCAPTPPRANMQREDTALELSALGGCGPSGSGKAAREELEASGSAPGGAAAREGAAEPDVEIAVGPATGARCKEASLRYCALAGLEGLLSSQICEWCLSLSR